MGYNGTEEIKEHPFFASIDWSKLSKRQVDPPYVPRIQSEYDLSNIDREFTREPAQETPDEYNKYLKDVKFDNFTYV